MICRRLGFKSLQIHAPSEIYLAGYTPGPKDVIPCYYSASGMKFINSIHEPYPRNPENMQPHPSNSTKHVTPL